MADCPVCARSVTLAIERRERVPIAQNLVFPEAEAARRCPVGRLDILRCRCCGFVWNAAFDPGLMRYDATYDNDQNFSEVFRAHVEGVADAILARAPAEGPLSLLEIGCGQGGFLALLRRRLGDRVRSAVGFDPAWKGDRAGLPDDVRIVGDYFGPGTVGQVPVPPDIVVSRHTIEHVPDPAGFLSAIRRSCEPGCLVFVETPTVEWVLRNGVFFDLYYEHCSLFDPASIRLALARAGFLVEAVRVVFEGQYMLAVARVPEDAEEVSEGGVDGACDIGDLGYRAGRDGYLARVRATIAEAAAAGGVALWGGASKGVTTTLMLGPDRGGLTCAIDMNLRKQGTFMPVSALPIVGPVEACRMGVRAAIILNPVYAEEIRRYCRANSLDLVVKSLAT